MTVTKSLKTKYQEEVKKALMEKFGYTNEHQIPALYKIVLNMGVGEASHNSKIAEAIEAQLTKIAGQKAVVTKAQKPQPMAGIQGGLIKMEAPLESSNVMVVCPACEKPTRIKHDVVDGKKVRVCKKCGEQLDA